MANQFNMSFSLALYLCSVMWAPHFCAEPSEARPSQGMDIFGLKEPHGNPWDSYTKVALEGDLRELVQSTQKIELLVSYDNKNPEHYKKFRAKETKREDLILLWRQAEYFRYLVPPVQLKLIEINQIKALLLGPDAYLEFGSGPKFATVITGPRFVVKFLKEDSEFLVTISKHALPSIWFSGDMIEPFGGLLHPDVESEWHRIIKTAEKNAGYD